MAVIQKNVESASRCESTSGIPSVRRLSAKLWMYDGIKLDRNS